MLIPSFAYVRIGARLYPFQGLAQASQAYVATIDRLDLGASRAPLCELLDSAGNAIGSISYNGRVWRGTWPDSQCIYDPRTERLRATYLARIGYDPFEDDPNLSCDDVEKLLVEYDAIAKA